MQSQTNSSQKMMKFFDELDYFFFYKKKNADNVLKYFHAERILFKTKNY